MPILGELFDCFCVDVGVICHAMLGWRKQVFGTLPVEALAYPDQKLEGIMQFLG